MKLQISYKIKNNNLKIYLNKQSLISRLSNVNFEEWSELSSYLPTTSSRLIDFLVSGEFDNYITISDKCVKISLESVSLFDEVYTQALGINSISDTLSLSSSGHVLEEDFSIDACWFDENARRLYNIKRINSFLFQGDTLKGRLPKKTEDILKYVEQINNNINKEENIAKLSNYLNNHQSNLDLNGTIKNTRVHHASSFSLELTGNSEDFNFKPVLKKKLINDFDEEKVSEVLPTNYNSKFDEKFLEKGGRESYLLDENNILITSPALNKSLKMLKTISESDNQTKKEFIANPRSFIRNIFEEDIEEEIIDSIFIETKEYSDRVSGIGLWEKPSLPWIEKKAEKWLPEYELFKNLSLIELKETHKQAKESLEKGDKTIIIDDVEVPLDETLISTMENLQQDLEEVTEPIEVNDEHISPEKDTTIKPAKKVLTVKENFDKINYKSKLTKRGILLNSVNIHSIKNSPKPYQIKGIKWLQNAWASGLPGVLLADDMGLGKTFQVLSFLAWLKENNKMNNPVLIVAPTTLLKNWEKEAEIHLYDKYAFGDLLKLYGYDIKDLKMGKEKESDIGKAQLDYKKIQEAGWVVCSYETMRDYHQSLAKVEFSCVIFDEMQKLKTPSSLVTQTSKSLNAKFKIGLTGTPVENRLADLFSISDILSPGLLGNLKDFSEKYEDTSKSQDELENQLKKLKTLLETSKLKNTPAFMLRRMKSDELKGLPKKIIIKSNNNNLMTDKQLSKYDNSMKKVRNNEIPMIKCLQDLRAISLHPDLNNNENDLDFINDSIKMQQCLNIIEEINKKDEKVLIFLESRAFQPILKRIISNKFNLDLAKIGIINGQTSKVKRSNIVDDFQNDNNGFGVLILSPKAAGTGLTITAANHVIHLSRWWNPAIEDQSTDRAYRIGQEKDVFVYYPFSVHPKLKDKSFDIILDNLISNKKNKANDLLLPLKISQEEAFNKFLT